MLEKMSEKSLPVAALIRLVVTGLARMRPQFWRSIEAVTTVSGINGSNAGRLCVALTNIEGGAAWDAVSRPQPGPVCWSTR